MSAYNVLETQFLLVPVGYNFITKQCKISITKIKQFKTLLSVLPGPFYEGQQGSFCIDRIWVFPPPPHRRLCSMQDVTQYHHRFGNISLVFPNQTFLQAQPKHFRFAKFLFTSKHIFLKYTHHLCSACCYCDYFIYLNFSISPTAAF